MLSKLLTTLSFCLFSLAIATEDADASAPGGIQSTMTVKSLNNILQLAAPLSGDMVFKNKTFEVNVDKKGFLNIYEVKINSIHFNSVEGFKILNFDFKEDTDTLELEIGGVNIDATVDGGVTALWLIPVDVTAFYATNFTMSMTLETSSTDGVHFKITEASLFELGDLNLTMSNSFWQKLVNTGHKTILNAVRGGLVKISDFLAAKVTKINSDIASQGPMTWMTNIISDKAPLNMTSTTYPTFSHSDGLIHLNFDGQFYDVFQHAQVVPEDAEQAPVEKKQKEQFWMHESTLNSLLFDLSDSYMPLNVSSPDISTALLQVFHEFAIAYGDDVQLSLGVKLSENHTTNAIALDKEKGIIFGSVEEDSLITVLQFYCSNSTVSNQLALELEMNLQAVFNVSLDNFLLTTQVYEPQIANTKTVTDNIGMYYHDYDNLLTNILKDYTYDFNESHDQGTDFKVLYPTLKFVSGMLKHSTITPFMENDFLFGGFAFISDF